ncbi:hypothetical protein EFD56_26080 [Rhizobium phaseoli]|nr:hypothetical protein EFD56_26080 [Rhizobium phaseoli]
MLRHMTTPSVTTRTGSQKPSIARRPSPWAYRKAAYQPIGCSIFDDSCHSLASPMLTACFIIPSRKQLPTFSINAQGKKSIQ